MTDADQVTIHSSWKGVITSLGGCGLTLLVGALAVWANGARLLPMIILGAGVVLTGGVLFDYPIAAVFDRDGVVRRALLRRHRLRWEQVDPKALGIMKRPVAAGRGAGDLLFDIVPGDPEGSILLHRMLSNDPGVAMPELGKATVDEEGTAAVRRWIEGMGT